VTNRRTVNDWLAKTYTESETWTRGTHTITGMFCVEAWIRRNAREELLGVTEAYRAPEAWRNLLNYLKGEIHM
jgi:hypothetical protein